MNFMVGVLRTSVTGQSLESLPLSMYKVIAAYKPEDTTIEKVGVL